MAQCGGMSYPWTISGTTGRDMIQENYLSVHVKPHLHAIPVCLAALVLWAVIGGWYISVAPPDMAGTDNIGLVLSTFGICLFLADRIAFLWLHVRSKLIVFSTWVWGLAFVAWGLLEWLHSFSSRFAVVFFIHWTVFLIVIASMLIWTGRRRNTSE